MACDQVEEPAMFTLEDQGGIVGPAIPGPGPGPGFQSEPVFLAPGETSGVAPVPGEVAMPAPQYGLLVIWALLLWLLWWWFKQRRQT